MATEKKVQATLKSAIGFYIGDVCYAMSDEDYDGKWHKDDYSDFEGTHELRGHRFAIGGTAYGDGEYEDQFGHCYGVDSGTIGILPYELCEKRNPYELDKLGRFVRAMTATFTAEDGEFDIKVGSECYRINTNDEYDDDEEDYDYNDYESDEDYD